MFQVSLTYKELAGLFFHACLQCWPCWSRRKKCTLKFNLNKVVKPQGRLANELFFLKKNKLYRVESSVERNFLDEPLATVGRLSISLYGKCNFWVREGPKCIEQGCTDDRAGVVRLHFSRVLSCHSRSCTSVQGVMHTQHWLDEGGRPGPLTQILSASTPTLPASIGFVIASRKRMLSTERRAPSEASYNV